MTDELLIGHRAPEGRIAVRAGTSITAGRFVADAAALARQLPPAQYVLNGCRDRYLFAVGFGAALLAGRTSLLPPSRLVILSTGHPMLMSTTWAPRSSAQRAASHSRSTSPP